MGLVDELKKLQQLKVEGVLTEEEFAQAKQKLLVENMPAAMPAPMQPPQTPPPSQAVQSSLRDDPNEIMDTTQPSLLDGLNEVMDERSTLGEAANRYVDYQKTSMIVGAIVFIIFIIVFAVIFSNAQSEFNHHSDNFPDLSPESHFFNER